MLGASRYGAMANSQSSAAWAGGATAKPVARTSAAQVLRKSATPARRVALRAPRAGRPAPITSRLHDVEPEPKGIAGSKPDERRVGTECVSPCRYWGGP